MPQLQLSLGSASSVAFCPWGRVAARRSGKTWWVVLQLIELPKKHPSQFLGLAVWFGGWTILPTILVEVEGKGWPDGRDGDCKMLCCSQKNTYVSFDAR